MKPSGSTTDPTKVYDCYKDANGGDPSSIVTFEAHEWDKVLVHIIYEIQLYVTLLLCCSMGNALA